MIDLHSASLFLRSATSKNEETRMQWTVSVSQFRLAMYTEDPRQP